MSDYPPGGCPECGGFYVQPLNRRIRELEAEQAREDERKDERMEDEYEWACERCSKPDPAYCPIKGKKWCNECVDRYVHQLEAELADAKKAIGIQGKALANALREVERLQPFIKIADNHRVAELQACEELKALHTRHARLLAAAKALATRLRRIHDDAEYRAIWESAQIHRGPYYGPQYEEQLKELEAACEEKPDAK